jgi:hypothetical protein
MSFDVMELEMYPGGDEQDGLLRCASTCLYTCSPGVTCLVTVLG